MAVHKPFQNQLCTINKTVWRVFSVSEQLGNISNTAPLHPLCFLSQEVWVQ